MSSPFVYTQSTTAQYPNQYQQTPYYYTPGRVNTPFIPDSSLYHNSPYSNPPSLPPSPQIGSAGALHFTSGTSFPANSEEDYILRTPYIRRRRPSWHTNNPQWVQPPSPTLHPFGIPTNHHRRHSFSSSYPVHSLPLATSEFFINPWLNAEAPRSDFIFDLDPTPFTPVRIYGPGQVAPLSHDELVQPATHPPINRLRILCDLIPQWPLDIQPNMFMATAANLTPYWCTSSPETYQVPPITLVDILVAIHRHLHKQISHADWAKLDKREEIAVGKAYTARCRAAQSIADHELAQGIKRVDFLLGKSKFVGLVRHATVDGWEIMKLHVKN